MGIFSATYRTYVNSTAYNMAGDINRRPQIIPQAILGSVLTNSDRGIGLDVLTAQYNSPASSQKRLFRWAANGLGSYVPGMPIANIGAGQNVSTVAVHSGLSTLITMGSNQSFIVTSAKIDDADTDYWAQDYIRNNYPLVIEDAWSATLNLVTSAIDIEMPGPVLVSIPASADLLWGMNRSDGRKLLFSVYTVLTTNAYNETTESEPILHVYRMGSGTLALDNLKPSVTTLSEFFPAVPLRLNNKSIRHVNHVAIFPSIEKAFRKLTSNGSNIHTFLDTLEANPDIAELDYAFITFGVSLNTKEKACQAYLYKFMKELINYQKSDETDFAAYTTDILLRNQSIIEWNRWLQAAGDQYSYYRARDLPAPSNPFTGISTPPGSEIQVASASIDHDIRINWNYIKETQHVGNAISFDGDAARLASLGALKLGEYWFYEAPDIQVGGFNPLVPVTREAVQNVEGTRAYKKIYMFHQHSRYQYSRLEIVGLEHRNNVYNNQTVTILATDALLDAEESGFIFPLHYPTFKSMGLGKSAQMSTANSYLVFNTYNTVTIQWWQRGIFQVLLIVISIVISVIFPPAGVTLGGILGTNLAVGTALGFSAVTAIAVGAVANAIAGMLLSIVIQQVSTAIFGKKLGAIIGTIVSFIAGQMATAYGTTGSFNVDWSTLMRAENLQNLTAVVSKAYTGWLNADTEDYAVKLEDAKNAYDKSSAEIEKVANEILGMTNGLIDPILLTENDEHLGESSETFLNRTLLTGSDIAELTFSMIDQFASVSLELPLAVR